jgi:hypothetical protein
MALDWTSIKPQHAEAACEALLRGEHRPRVTAKGLFVLYRNQYLPAKHVLRIAYCMANNLPLDKSIKFSSGEGTLRRLTDLGLQVERGKSKKSMLAG